MQTPTMTFGEIGTTKLQATGGYPRKMGGVGHFEKTQILERMRLLSSGTWAASDAIGSITYSTDLMKALAGISQNQDVMSQFEYFRADVELTFRLNTNQFYYGALMVTMFPFGTGARMDERAVLDPVIISASSAEATVKTWKYSYPFPWMSVAGANAGWYPVNLIVDVLAPLTMANASMPSTVSIQLWARFTNVELSYPTTISHTPRVALFSPTSSSVITISERERQRSIKKRMLKKKLIEAHSSEGSIKVKYPKKGGIKHPADDYASGVNSVDAAIDAISSVTIGDAVSEVKSLASFVTDNWGSFASSLGFLLDKPDQSDNQTPIIIEASKDLFTTDIADTNVSLSMYKNRYVDPGGGRMPMTKNWTLSEYARIPGLRGIPLSFTAEAQAFTIDLIQRHTNTTTFGIPLDYAVLCGRLWRGSVKVSLLFYTAAFISARFVVQYINSDVFPATYPTEYDSGLSKVINVKGDTIDCFTLPWLNHTWWEPNVSAPQIQITCASEIANTDTSASPTIYCAVFVAGGDDIQFAWPVVPDYVNYWSSSPTRARDKGKEKEPDDVEAHTTPGSLFATTFPPIGEDAQYDIDTGYCTSEMLGPMTDIAKRYSPLTTPTATGITPTLLIPGQTLDDVWSSQGPSGSVGYYNWVQFRYTLFGAMRACFLYRSGGLRYRYFSNGSATTPPLFSDSEGRSIGVTLYHEAYDNVSRITIPQVMFYPYGALGYNNGQMTMQALGTPPVDAAHPQYLAARDDVQFGYPILPARVQLPL